MIASSAEDKSKNRLSTQTISYSDITNKADYSVNSFSAGAGYGTGGVNISAPSTYHHGDDDASKTKSAVEIGALIVRDEQNQTQLVSELSHDTKGAHKELKQIFDEEKELERKRTLALVSEAAQQAKTFKTKYDKVDEKYFNTKGQGNENKNSGTGSDFNKRVDQAAAIVTGIITGDVGVAASGVLAPEVANLIKRATYEEDENGNQKMAAANILAHAAGGAALAGIAGGDVLAGAGAAAGGEIIAGIVRNQLYAGKTNKELTEADKQNISNAAQLLTGLGAGLVSDNDGKAIATAVTSSKNAVENNYLNGNEMLSLDKELAACKVSVGNCDKIIQKYIDISNERSKKLQKDCKNGGVICSVLEEIIENNIEFSKGLTDGKFSFGDTMTDENAKVLSKILNERDLKYLNENVSTTDRVLNIISQPQNLVLALLGGRNLLINFSTKPKITSTVMGLSGGLNAMFQYTSTGDVKLIDVIGSSIVGGITVGTGYNTTVTWNTAGGYYMAKLKGEDPNISAITSMVSSKVGYVAGSFLEKNLNNTFNSVSKSYEFIPIGMWTITKSKPKSNFPVILGNGADSFMSEFSDKVIEKINKE